MKALYSLHNKYIKDRKRERIGAGSEEKLQILKVTWFFVLKVRSHGANIKAKAKYFI